MLPPINLIFKCLQQNAVVSVWLSHQSLRIEGKVKGFDEYMNLVLEDAREITNDGKKENLGQILLKGDSISMITTTEI
ncbi:hypothetical protein JNB11_08255 [Kocuria palustris]|nr:hypothetical protein [Kocuria palustris]